MLNRVTFMRLKCLLGNKSVRNCFALWPHHLKFLRSVVPTGYHPPLPVPLHHHLSKDFGINTCYSLGSAESDSFGPLSVSTKDVYLSH